MWPNLTPGPEQACVGLGLPRRDRDQASTPSPMQIEVVEMDSFASAESSPVLNHGFCRRRGGCTRPSRNQPLPSDSVAGASRPPS